MYELAKRYQGIPEGGPISNLDNIVREHFGSTEDLLGIADAYRAFEIAKLIAQRVGGQITDLETITTLMTEPLNSTKKPAIDARPIIYHHSFSDRNFGSSDLKAFSALGIIQKIDNLHHGLPEGHENQALLDLLKADGKEITETVIRQATDILPEIIEYRKPTLIPGVDLRLQIVNIPLPFSIRAANVEEWGFAIAPEAYVATFAK